MIQTSSKAFNSRLATPEPLMRMDAAALDSGIEAHEGLSLQHRYIVYVLTFTWRWVFPGHSILVYTRRVMSDLIVILMSMPR